MSQLNRFQYTLPYTVTTGCTSLHLILVTDYRIAQNILDMGGANPINVNIFFFILVIVNESVTTLMYIRYIPI